MQNGTAPTNGVSLTRYAWLSIATALTTITLKTGAYLLTNSVSLLSDAVESVVNLLAGMIALAMLSLAERPPDDDHAYGHAKAEYFASAAEGALIVAAAGAIAFTAWQRLMHPQELQQIGLGLGISVLASLVNLATAMILMKVGRKHNSITLEADAKHILTDVWTTAGVLVGIGLVSLTGWIRLDPIIAILVAANIVWTGVSLMRRSALGLLDTQLPPAEKKILEEILQPRREQGIQFHALRTRTAATRRFVSVHVLVPGEWTVQQGHDFLESFEAQIRSRLGNTTVTTHLEPLEDPVSWKDDGLDRHTE
jgi:cation diffusion facilitator family transporter